MSVLSTLQTSVYQESRFLYLSFIHFEDILRCRHRSVDGQSDTHAYSFNTSVLFLIVFSFTLNMGGDCILHRSRGATCE